MAPKRATRLFAAASRRIMAYADRIHVGLPGLLRRTLFRLSAGAQPCGAIFQAAPISREFRALVDYAKAQAKFVDGPI